MLPKLCGDIVDIKASSSAEGQCGVYIIVFNGGWIGFGTYGKSVISNVKRLSVPDCDPNTVGPLSGRKENSGMVWSGGIAS
jgi:hypothetical protein